MLCGIVQPEMMALSVRVRDIGAAHPLNGIEHGGIREGCSAQFSPIHPAAASNHIVNGGRCEALMVQMAVDQEFHSASATPGAKRGSSLTP